MRWIALWFAALTPALWVAGCGCLTDQPAVSPDRWAPASAEREWTASPATAEAHTPAASDFAPPRAASSSPQVYDLDGLIELALRHNPRTQSAWSSAMAAAAQFGAAQAPYYPQATAAADSGYTRIPFELPGAIGAVNQWESQPLVSVTYILLDFGRRHSASDAARERLIASDFAFNRTVQEVIFETQSAFYALDGALASVTAAERNLELAETDYEAVNQRVNLGLATEPELLLARERVAQSKFDLANARLLVHDAQAALATALGVPANSDLRIASLESLPVPKSLGPAVDALIDEARRSRPDLAARMAAVHASQAQVAEARARFLPTVGLSGEYGEDLWNFTFVQPRTIQTGQPQYAALLTLRWDLFAGFRHLNDLRQAEAEQDVAGSDLRTLEIDTVAEVWRAYYEFQSSQSKYKYAQSLMAATREAYAANLDTYKQGLSTIVELLTAERDLANARYTLVRTKAELLTASATVAFAVGAMLAR